MKTKVLKRILSLKIPAYKKGGYIKLLIIVRFKLVKMLNVETVYLQSLICRRKTKRKVFKSNIFWKTHKKN